MSSGWRIAAACVGGWRCVSALGKSAPALCIALSLMGCGVTRGQLEAVSTFGKSATALADGVKSAYVQAAQDEGDLRTAQYVVLFRDNDFKPDPIRSHPPAYTRPLVRLAAKDIAGRLAAASALTAYGQALTTLLDAKSQEGDLASATDKLTASLKGIPTQTLKNAQVTAGEIDDVGKLITSFGDLYLDYRRREVLEQVVPIAEPVVTKICVMFERDFDVDAGQFATIYRDATREIITDVSVSLDKNADSLERRAVLLPIYQRASAVKGKMEVSYASVKDAAKSCSKSSRALAASIKNPELSIDDIIDFATKAQTAYNAVVASANQK